MPNQGSKLAYFSAISASRLASSYVIAGDGEQARAFGRWALGTGCLDAAAASRTRTVAGKVTAEEEAQIKAYAAERGGDVSTLTRALWLAELRRQARGGCSARSSSSARSARGCANRSLGL